MLKVEPFKQSKKYLCGPASLKMVLSYYGICKTEKEIARQTKTTSMRGCSLQNLIKYSQSLGLKAEYKDNFSIQGIEKLVNLKIPIIVDWFSVKGEGHYSVITNILKDTITYIDPYFGKIEKIKKQEFLFRWFDFVGPPSKNNLVLKRAIIIKK